MAKATPDFGRVGLLILASLTLASCSDSVTAPSQAPKPLLSLRAATDTSTSGVPMTRLETWVSLSSAYAVAINDHGDVVGYGRTSSMTLAFLWPADGGVRMLDTLGSDTFTAANDLNNRGQIVGSSYTADGEEHIVVWTMGDGMEDLGTLPTAIGINARGINQHGQIAVWAMVEPSMEGEAYLWSPRDGWLDLGTLGGTFSQPTAINDKGTVVGWSYESAAEIDRAFLWTEKDGMQALGTLGGSYSLATDINQHGQVVGRSTVASGQPHAFLWTEKDGMQDLGTLGGVASWANGINDRGQVVGAIETASGETHGFIWSAKGGVQDLGCLRSSHYCSASDINKAGRIVGYDGPEDRVPVMWIPDRG